MNNILGICVIFYYFFFLLDILGFRKGDIIMSKGDVKIKRKELRIDCLEDWVKF